MFEEEVKERQETEDRRSSTKVDHKRQKERQET
jgi:hypothetical protein